MNRFVKVLGFSLIGIAILSFFGYISIEVLEGRGGEIYKSYKGLNFIPIGIFIFFLSIPLFVTLAKVWGDLLGREERDFIRYLKLKKRCARLNNSNLSN